MTITTTHPASEYGVPVILDARGRVVGQVPGLLAVMAELGWDRAELARRCNVSVPTVNGWLAPGTPRRPEVRCLNVLRDALAAKAAP